jgi:hypothetical protein
VRAASDERGGDDGAAVLEFITLGVLMLVPLVYLVLALGRLQAGSYAAQAAARAAARAYTAAPDQAAAEASARDAVLLATGDQGFAVDPSAVTTVSCDHDPCLQPQGRVSVQVRLDVVLPGVPALVDRHVPVRIPVQADSVAVVDRFRSFTSTPNSASTPITPEVP